jgi:dCTP deaminase
MTVLSDSDLLSRGYQLIDPFDPAKVQPASYDLSLNPEILVLRDPLAAPDARVHTLDLRTATPGDYTYPVIMTRQGYTLEPGQCVLGSTVERITCPRDCVAQVEGRSSLGRVFLSIHVTSGFVHPAFDGQVTLEIVNHSPWRLMIWPRMSIAQISFSRMTGPSQRPYGAIALGSRYQGQIGTTPAANQQSRARP